MSEISRHELEQKSGVGFLIYDGGDPSGVLAAPAGMILIEKSIPAVYQNQDGGTTWNLVADGTSSASEVLAQYLATGRNPY